MRRSSDRSRLRSTGDGRSAKVAWSFVQLAPGVRLRTNKQGQALLALAFAGGDVHVNTNAAAILRLCDGSRTREAIVTEIVAQSNGGTLASDIVDFLNAAHARGWVVEAQAQHKRRTKG